MDTIAVHFAAPVQPGLRTAHAVRPKPQGNVDHLAIGPSGVIVIDNKSSRGRVQLSTVGIIKRRAVLLVNGRDRTSQLDSLERQIARVGSVLDRQDAADVAGSARCAFPFMRREWLHYSRARDGRITSTIPLTSPSSANAPERWTPTRSPGWPRLWPRRSRRLDTAGQSLAGSRSTGTCEGNVGACTRR